MRQLFASAFGTFRTLDHKLILICGPTTDRTRTLVQLRLAAD
jgi:hypothetical protein